LISVSLASFTELAFREKFRFDDVVLMG
jgi:hypothetical protein